MNSKPVTKLGSNLVGMLLGGSLILLGFLFLVGRFVNLVFDFDIGHYAWPFFVIIPGVLIFLIAITLDRQPGIALAVFGGMVTMAGCILMLQNIFDLYASWAYAWALVVPTSVGLAKMIYGAVHGLQDEVRSGLTLAGIGAAIFVIGGFFFEMVIGISGFNFGMSWFCLPSLLIGLGAILLIFTFTRRQNPPAA
jgi:hypothetical protein